ncbi:MAG: radical SAM family heme chaperone HemW [Candidatus Kapabacteria bacterium]|jgi:oxygen-independent coproporphyrinogen-3 oxidase|nr:radical SAM family heme chaperone HemW [Candidatus Kapabacteria bacterium]
MLGLYLHIPFCEKKCIYCDFYSLETTHLIAGFVETLQQEIRLRAALLPQSKHHFDTVFFGGGTPSLLSPEQMKRIIVCLHEHFTFADDAEWTMECNPGTITRESLQHYRRLGINRISYGVQSFFEEDLRFLSRIHSKDEAVQAINLSRDAGFENVNLDLMFALPNQSFRHWQRNLETAIALKTDHISAYSLIFEPGTPLNAMRERGEVQPQHEEHDAEMYAWAIQTLAQHGYKQYEVSNFATDGKFCRHNCIYWQGDEYVSFGPSAHGYISGEQGFMRYWNVRSLKRYTDSVHAGLLPLTNSEFLSDTDRMFERTFLELRSQGIRKREFMRDFGISIDAALRGMIQEFTKDALLVNTPERLSLSPEGYAVCDALTLEAITALERFSGNIWQKQEVGLTDGHDTTEELAEELTEHFTQNTSR